MRIVRGLHLRRRKRPVSNALATKVLACEAGVSIEPGAQAAGTKTEGARAHEMSDSAVARFAGSHSYMFRLPGACAPGFILPPASQVQRTISLNVTCFAVPDTTCFAVPDTTSGSGYNMLRRLRIFRVKLDPVKTYSFFDTANSLKMTGNSESSLEAQCE
jgi:hypothetical protein